MCNARFRVSGFPNGNVTCVASKKRSEIMPKSPSSPKNIQPANHLAIALAQLNPIVGDLAGNAAKIRTARAEAARLGADLVVLPELFLIGYPPEDLVLKPAFRRAARIEWKPSTG